MWDIGINSERQSHGNPRAEVVISDGPLMFPDCAQLRRQVIFNPESEGFVERSVPGNVTVRGQGDRIKALQSSPGNGRFHQPPTETLPSVIGVHRQLPDVRDAGHHLDAYKPDWRFADHEDEHGLVEVVFDLVVSEWTDPYRLEHPVCCELDVAQIIELIRTCTSD
jgi:hypothetical protein